MGKVAIVGVEGSGKTVLMGALCECYKRGSKDEPYLMPENQAAFMFMERVPHLLRVERRWPEATSVSSLRAMRWTLRLGADVLEEIEMLDYPGELYRLAFGERTKEESDGHRTELNEFLEHLTSADTLIVLLNLGDIQGLGANARNAETVWITRGIFDFAGKLTNLKHKALVFTQADRHEAALKAAGGAEGVYANQLPMLKTLFPDLKVIAVSAVSGTDVEGRPEKNCSTAGCLELMREILAELDAGIIRCLGLCETFVEKINAFSSGSPDDFAADVAAYSNAVTDFVKASKPLAQVYANRVEWHQTRVSNLSYMMSSILSLCSGASADILANRATWAGLRETHDSFSDMFDAFLKHFRAEVKRLKQLKLDEEENAKKRAMLAAKEKRQMIVVFTIIALLVIGIAGLSIYSDWSVKKSAWEKARTDYETAVTEVAVKVSGKASETESRGLLDKYGGEKWRRAQALADLGDKYEWKDLPLGKSHFESATALMQELVTTVLAERTEEVAAQIAEERRRIEATNRAEAERRAEERRLEENRLAKLREAAAARDTMVLECIKNARSAFDDKEWKLAIMYANRALGVDSDKSEAKVLKARAEEELAAAKEHEEMLERTVGEALENAREAKKCGNWKMLEGYANDILKIRPYHDEARSLKADAEEGLLPRLVLQATTNGALVVAQVSDGQTSYSTPKAFVLRREGRYGFCLSFRDGVSGIQYSDEVLKVEANWEGWTTNTVDLKEAPSLRICAEVDGNEVEAELSDGVSLYKTPKVLTLRRGSKYVFTLNHVASEKAARFVRRTLNYSADWQGQKTDSIRLSADNGRVRGDKWKSPATGMAFIWISNLNLWVGKYEVTNGEYEKMIASQKRSWQFGSVDSKDDRLPVNSVKFDDAKAYADWLTEQDREYLNGLCYRVISEKDWLTCAQCGDERTYPWGNSLPPKFGNYCGAEWDGTNFRFIGDYSDGSKYVCPVEKSGANDWGLFGIGGNVWEGCAVSASGDAFGTWRGASAYCFDSESLRCDYRFRGDGSLGDPEFGFRLVLSR